MAGAGPKTRLIVLNGFELTSDGVAVALSMSAQRLLALLALCARPVLRPYVAGTLWPESSEERAQASLRSALWRLQQARRGVVEAAGPLMRLAPAVEVDLRDSETLAHWILGEGETNRGAMDADPSPLLGDLLPGWYDDWVVLEQERFRQLRLRALDALCLRLTEARRFSEALETGLAALRAEPLRESAHRALVRVHLAEGNAADALRQYRLCRRLLREQLGIVPSEQMERLVRDITPGVWRASA